MKWIQWLLLTSLTGSPIVSLLILVVVWWVIDRFTLGILPDPVRFVARFRRTRDLRTILSHNPHDRRARLELADLMLDRKKPAEALDLLQYNLDAGDDDVRTLYLAGRAAFGAKKPEQGEALSQAARAIQPGYNSGAIDLELGRGFLGSERPQDALAALERHVDGNHTAIEGRVLLARARAETGDADGAKAARDAAWQNYRTAPRFVRRRNRWWAWRAKPHRPVLYAGLAAVAGALLLVASRVGFG